MNYRAYKRDNLLVVKLALAGFWVLLTLWPTITAAETLEELGGFERDVADFALAKLGVTPEPDPAGKTLREIRVVNLPVFTEKAGLLQLANVFHVTTRKHIIAREVLLRPGDVWNEKIVEESKRILSDPTFTSVVVLLPVKVEEDSQSVDLLVGTRDVFSLRLNSNIEFQNGLVTFLQIAPTEANVFGFRKNAQLVFSLTQGNFSVGPTYIDRNVLGKRMQLSATGRLIYSRSERELEGSTSTLELGRPLFSLATRWGWSAGFFHRVAPFRIFQGGALRTYDNPDTDAEESIPWRYNSLQMTANLKGLRSFGTYWKQNVTAGYSLSLLRPTVDGSFPSGGVPDSTEASLAIARQAFERDVLPRSERASRFSLRYEFFEADFAIYRNLDSFSLAENFRNGPFAVAEVSIANRIWGSQRNFGTGLVSVGWQGDIEQQGYVSIAGTASTRIQAGEFIDNGIIGTFKLALPPVWFIRPVFRATTSMRFNERGNTRYIVGGASGLRGFDIGEFFGQKSYVVNAELRTRPIRLWIWRLGGLAFWDGGHATDRFKDLTLQHNIGLGLRLVAPEAQPSAFRFDWALPLSGGNSGFPGRFTAGFGQNF